MRKINKQLLIEKFGNSFMVGQKSLRKNGDIWRKISDGKLSIPRE